MKRLIKSWVVVYRFHGREWRTYHTYFPHFDHGYQPGYQLNFGHVGVTVRLPGVIARRIGGQRREQRHENNEA